VAGLCNGDVVGLLSGKNWIIMYYVHELCLQMDNVIAGPNTSNCVIISSVPKWCNFLYLSWRTMQLIIIFFGLVLVSLLWCCLYKFELFWNMLCFEDFARLIPEFIYNSASLLTGLLLHKKVTSCMFTTINCPSLVLLIFIYIWSSLPGKYNRMDLINLI
jgi:hypothetical protein